jgi:hypothetical protein
LGSHKLLRAPQVGDVIGVRSVHDPEKLVADLIQDGDRFSEKIIHNARTDAPPMQGVQVKYE